VSDIIHNFIDWAHHQLLEHDEPQEYLLRRGSSFDQWKNHSLGYVNSIFDPSPDTDPRHNSECGSIDNKNLWCETCKFNYWSTGWDESSGKNVAGLRLLNSIVYPLTTYSGSFIGFQTRSLAEKRYDTFVRTRRPEAFFFGTAFHINKIWTRRTVFLVEGPSDLLTLERFTDFPVLSLITNSTNENQTRFMSRFCDRIVLFLDLDKAGRDGSLHIKNKLSSKDVILIDYKYPNISAKDVNDMWMNLKDERFAKHISKLTSHL
jgi:5S rRNA maturation endonuclease (ribonuclease M5)